MKLNLTNDPNKKLTLADLSRGKNRHSMSPNRHYKGMRKLEM